MERKNERLDSHRKNQSKWNALFVHSNAFFFLKFEVCNRNETALQSGLTL